MADSMTLTQALAATISLALSAGSTAQPFADPTRPPLELMGAHSAAAPTPLQSILLSSTRKGAIINGQYVPLGGAYGNARLVKITATEVTLRTGRTLEVLHLYPPLDRNSAASGAEKKSKETVTRP